MDRLAAGDRPGAVSRALELLDEGYRRQDVRELIARAQLEVGRLWQSNTWSVAQEHIATGISESVLHATATGRAPHAEGGHVLVACAAGEWHVLPARLLAEELADAGFRVTFAGGSVPPQHLIDTVRSLAPDVVAVSCTLSLNLTGAARTIAAVHAAGRPALAGGAAFGADTRRAEAVGADAWAGDLAGAARIVAHLISAGEPPADRRARPADREVDRLSRAEERLVEAAYRGLGERFPDLAGYSPWQIERTREDIAYHLRYLASAVMVADDRVYLEMVAWLVDLLAARGVPARAVELTIELLAELAAAEELPESRRILDLAGAH